MTSKLNAGKTEDLCVGEDLFEKLFPLVPKQAVELFLCGVAPDGRDQTRMELVLRVEFDLKNGPSVIFYCYQFSKRIFLCSIVPQSTIRIQHGLFDNNLGAFVIRDHVRF